MSSPLKKPSPLAQPISAPTTRLAGLGPSSAGNNSNGKATGPKAPREPTKPLASIANSGAAANPGLSLATLPSSVASSGYNLHHAASSWSNFSLNTNIPKWKKDDIDLVDADPFSVILLSYFEQVANEKRFGHLLGDKENTSSEKPTLGQYLGATRHTRPLVYFAFSRYIQTQLLPDATQKLSSIEICLNWFNKVYPKFSLASGHELWVRLNVFYWVDKLAMHTSIKVTARPLFDILCTIGTDIKPWLEKYENQALESIQSYGTELAASPGPTQLRTDVSVDADIGADKSRLNKSANDASAKRNLIAERFQDLFCDLIALPTVGLSSLNIDSTLQPLFTESSTNVYSTFISFISRLASRLKYLHAIKDMERQQRLARERAMHVMVLGDEKTDVEKVCDDIIFAAVKRADWCITTVEKMVKRWGNLHGFLAVELKKLCHEMARIPSIIQTINAMEAITYLVDATKNTIQNSSTTAPSNPPMTTIKPRTSPFMKTLIYKMTPTEILHSFTASEKILFDHTDSNELGMKLAHLEGMHVQVDPILERLVMPSLPYLQEVAMEETICSLTGGDLILWANEMQWVGLDKEEFGRGGKTKSVGWRCRYTDIVKFNYGKVVFENDGEDNTSFKPYGNGNNTNTGSSNDISKPKPIFQAQLTTNYPQQRAQDKQRKIYFVSIVTADEIFKLYPFYDEEVVKMLDLLTNITGLEPFEDAAYIKSVLVRKLELARRHVLSGLLQQDRPWIEHSAELNSVLAALTSETKPQHIWDMERLFHSCRLEMEVTKEAITEIRRIWHNSQSEQAKLKILSVVDRLLDKAVMNQGDSNFNVMFKWLKHLEESISPYKSAEALRVAMQLVKRAKAIQIEPLTPLMNNQLPTLFDAWKENTMFLRFYGIRDA